MPPLVSHPWRVTYALSAILKSYVFDTLALSDGSNSATLTTAVTSQGLTFARNSIATAQTSASTKVVSGIAANQVRICDFGNGRGLLIEDARTNRVLQSEALDNASWTKSANTAIDASAGNDPSGALTADDVRASAASAGNSCRAFQGSLAALEGSPCVGSAWVRQGSQGTAASIRMGATADNSNVVLTTSWQRKTHKIANGPAADTYFIVYPGNNGDAGNFAAGDEVRVAFAQAEQGKYATSYIPTTTVAVTRAAETVYATASAVQSTNGTYNRVAMEIRTIPEMAGTDITTAPGVYVWYIDANNNLEIDGNQKAILRIAGALHTSVASMVFSAFDVVDIWFECGANVATVIKYRVNGGSATSLPASGSVTHSPAFGASALYFLSTSSGTAVFSSCLQYVNAYTYTGRASWA